jgi:hypothetical protein
MAVTNPYADSTHVQAHMSALGSGYAFTISTSSVPTLAQVEGFLDQVAAEINGILAANGYGTIPATGANDILLIRRYVSIKAAALTYHAGFTVEDQYMPGKVKRWEADYDAFITRLTARQQRLIDQSPRAKFGVIQVQRYRSDADEDYAALLSEDDD